VLLINLLFSFFFTETRLAAAAITRPPIKRGALKMREWKMQEWKIQE